jgi:hypothetical protein
MMFVGHAVDSYLVVNRVFLRDMLFVMASLAVFAIVVLLRYAWHRCPHRDPLCTRDRPCIACYRELFNSAES